MADRHAVGAHETHDLELVARAAAGHLADGEVIRARELLASCEACADVAADLRAIAAATRELGSAASGLALARAPRDFRLTDADAARLRRRGFLGLGRLAGAPGRARAFGGALAALGLVGLLVSAGMPSLFTGAGGAAETSPIDRAMAPAPAEGLPKATGSVAAELAPAASAGGDLAAGAEPAGDAGPQPSQAAPTSSGSAILAAGSVIVLLAGLSLVLAARGGRRAGP